MAANGCPAVTGAGSTAMAPTRGSAPTTSRSIVACWPQAASVTVTGPGATATVIVCCWSKGTWGLVRVVPLLEVIERVTRVESAVAPGHAAGSPVTP